MRVQRWRLSWMSSIHEHQTKQRELHVWAPYEFLVQYKAKQQLRTWITLFCAFFLPSLQDMNTRQLFFFFFNTEKVQALTIQLQNNSPPFDKWNEME